ncbi:hypothetical protein ACFQGT_05490 [Natrialbaceae archaeon GCM10025810]|uniref:hypothetical protein n=1 Tax=Halovalidus salilacus TaxID=3075124 RepID=UPI003612AD54
MRAEGFVRSYYEALRRGEPLSPYFRESGTTVKFGISESLFGYDDVSAALTEQTRTTEEWTVESERLVVDEPVDGVATFGDEVALGWTDRERDERRSFDTRWSGTIVARSSDDPGIRDADSVGEDSDEEESGRRGAKSTSGPDAETHVTPPWAFATMHVSAAHEL